MAVIEFVLKQLPGALLTFGVMYVWLVAYHDPRVIADARREYVEIARLEAAQAKAAELERQRNAGAQALEEYMKRLAAAQQLDAEEDARHETEIAEYEKLLAAAGRACFLDDADTQFLLKP